MKIKFNQPVVLENSMEYLGRAVRNNHLSGVGEFTSQCEGLLKRETGSPHLLVSSATHALEMMALLLEIKPGDEVIIPSFTFVSTANAFALRGARIRFADNDEFGNIKLSEVERLLSSKTKAVMAVHYAGHSADMNMLSELCARAGAALVEDNAQGLGSNCHGRALGTFGRLGCISFHETKNVTSGEGGSLIVNDESLFERAEIIREKGTNRRRFLRGQVDKYTWVDVGSSYVLSELNAAYLLPQLEALEAINRKRLAFCERYKRELTATLNKLGIDVLGTPAHNEKSNGHMFALVFPRPEQRTAFIGAMAQQGVSCPFHYVSLHSSPLGMKLSGGKCEELPGCERLSNCLVRLPLFYNMTDTQQTKVIESVVDWVRKL